MSRLCLVTLCLSLGAGCLQLDPFLFGATPSETDVLEPGSSDPRESVDPARIERLRVRVNDQVECSAVEVTANEVPSRGHVFYFPGQANTLDDAFPRIKRLANAGFDVFALSYRGFGTSSDVKPTEAGIAEDVRAGLAFLRARLPPATPVGYYGRSLGTAIAVELAVDMKPAALVLESPFASIEAFKTDASGMDFPVGFLADARYDTEARIGRVFSPLLVLHGRVDDYVRHEFGVRVHAAANEPKRLILVPGADHGNVPQKMGDAWENEVRAHFDALGP